MGSLNVTRTSTNIDTPVAFAMGDRTITTGGCVSA